MPTDKEKAKRAEKWQWKMDYCKREGIPPAHKWAWDEAEKAFNAEKGGAKCQ